MAVDKALDPSLYLSSVLSRSDLTEQFRAFFQRFATLWEAK